MIEGGQVICSKTRCDWCGGCFPMFVCGECNGGWYDDRGQEDDGEWD